MTAYKEPDVAYVNLMDRRHEIVWHTMGPLSESSIRALTRELANITEVQQQVPYGRIWCARED